MGCFGVSLFLLAVLWFVWSSAVIGCSDDSYAIYHLTFEGLWTKERFPKVYPNSRPKAEWSTVVGRTHNQQYTLFSQSQLMSDEMKSFVEVGDATDLAGQGQGDQLIFDMFSTPPLADGSGVVEAIFLASSSQNKVSLAAKIVPSPDWFVGVDSLPLCHGGRWLESYQTELWPLDGGTQRGYTFTSPRWRSDPVEVITEITNLHPNHSADAFYYPQLTSLPAIASVTIKLGKVLAESERSQDMESTPDQRASHKPQLFQWRNRQNTILKPPVPTLIQTNSGSYLRAVFKSEDTEMSSNTTIGYPPSTTTTTTTPTTTPTTTSTTSAATTPTTTPTTNSVPINSDSSSSGSSEQLETVGLSPELTTPNTSGPLTASSFHSANLDPHTTPTPQATTDERPDSDLTPSSALTEATLPPVPLDGGPGSPWTTKADRTTSGADGVTSTTTAGPVSEASYTPGVNYASVDDEDAFDANEGGSSDFYEGDETFPSTSPLATNKILSMSEIDNMVDESYYDKECLVSDWSDWGECSKTCGYGRKVRTRTIVRWTGNVPCPELTMEQLCGSMKQCNWNHFSLAFNSSKSLLTPQKLRRRPKPRKNEDGSVAERADRPAGRRERLRKQQRRQ